MNTYQVNNQYADKRSNQHTKNRSRGNQVLLFGTLFMMVSMLSSCSVVAGIFKAGMGFGIFIVVLIIAAIVMLVVKAGKK